MKDKSGQTIVVFVRHGETDPDKNLSVIGQVRGEKAGEMLRRRGLRPEIFVSSPQLRAIKTLGRVLKGANVSASAEELIECPELGAATDGSHAYTSDEIVSLKKQCGSLGTDLETGLMTLPDFADKLKLRGQEGADKLQVLVAENPGKVILIASHGGSRMEAVVADLLGVTLDSIKPFRKGEFCILRFNPDGKPEEPERIYPEL